ncbi:MAG: hypothetical protein IKY08_01420 [Firmicutes bacterium]|nr:hypothetical protein [Bacillota bacterium]
MIDKWLEEMIHEPEPLNELERERVMEKIMEQVPTKRGAARRRRGSAAAACVAVLALSAVGFGATVMDGGLADLLGGGSEQSREIISEMGTIFEDQSQSVAGYTVTLKLMIHDRNGCYVLLGVSQDDDAALKEGYYYFDKTTVGLPDITRSGWFLDQPEIHNGTSDSVEMILHYDAAEKVTGKTLKIQFENFGYLDEEGEYIILGEGTWNFEIPMGKEDHTQTFRLDQAVTFKRGGVDKTITVDTLYLSPMSLTMMVSDNYQSTDPREITVKRKDGSVMDFRSGGYSTGGVERLFGNRTQVDYLFDHVIDPQEIGEIWFNGTKLEL